MDLLQETKKTNKKSNGQKIVLTLLIISIILCIGVAAALFMLNSEEKEIAYTLNINDTDISLSSIGLSIQEDGKRYVPIKNLCAIFAYQYLNGMYNAGSEDKDKCYINNDRSIIQFLADSNLIFKTSEKDDVDYEYYELKSPILLINDDLCIDLEDLNVGFNVIQYYVPEKNQTIIKSPEYWITKNMEEQETAGRKINNDLTDNYRSIAYNQIVVQTNNRYGVINTANQEIIGNKYNDMRFIEYNKSYIVSNNDNKYGIINMYGEIQVGMQYDSIEIINYNPLLYKVKKVNNYGIMREDGTIIGNEIKYSSIGFPKDSSRNIFNTVLIKKIDENTSTIERPTNEQINENIPVSIIVNMNGQYGLIKLEDGEEVLPCSLKAIYLNADNNTGIKRYVVEVKLTDVELTTYLEEYVDYINRITVKVN